MAERQLLVDRVAVDRQAGRLPDADVVPRGVRLPLVREIQPERRGTDCGPQLEARGLHQLLGELATYRVGDVDLAPLECGEPRGFVGYHPQHDALYTRRLAPVL